MRAVIQRVTSGAVDVSGERTGAIQDGLVVLLGVSTKDTEKDVDYLAEKIVNLRIFEDDQEKMNRSLIDVQGKLLSISQFTLYGDTRKGRRPNFMQAAKPDQALERYQQFNEKVRQLGIEVEEGRFGEHMEVSLVNDGPVTLIIDTDDKS
ncbi:MULTISPECIES: D-aminoacyl-tRNA deacylase [Allobacillus]|uniref:D-aminoacyl-tRNA deacylase n=1 Tax=Allobacillus salarius TaxID=1955272 RepID=A0A556PTT9_9BACI|nr:D-aminoacyl-tRNA deacylase [Allobacillus salarius]TSJ67804.1 D-tyrosyl-tRNA(Tyr) deacylase [Allobacillus salarius]